MNSATREYRYEQPRRESYYAADRPRRVADIPNQHGFRLVALLRDGQRVPCHVERGPDGCHRLAGVEFASVAAWVAVDGQNTKC